MRVAIVNDLALATESLRRLLLELPGIHVAWTAVDGREAVEKARADRPDLILMDMVMPVMDGPEATRRIMKESPCAIVVVTATVGGNAERVYEALSAGALDATETPGAGPDGRAARDMLARKIDQVRRLKGASGPPCCGPVDAAAPAPRPADAMVPPPPPRLSAGPSAGWPDPPEPGSSAGGPSPIVAIGASTGGPAALAAILAALPADFPFAIVAVQHLEASFVPGLVSWLSRETHRPVEIARSGGAAKRGVCSIAAGEFHLLLDGRGRFAEAREPAESVHRPSVDVFFRSLVESRVPPFAAVLLTGMGRDGAEGLLQLRQAGWSTIAQDRGTSVVWGMPGAADRIGAATSILPLPMIAPELMLLARSADRRRK